MFVIQMYAYIHQNSGLAILLHVAVAMGFGYYYNLLALGVVGFVTAAVDMGIYNYFAKHRLAVAEIKK